MKIKIAGLIIAGLLVLTGCKNSGVITTENTIGEETAETVTEENAVPDETEVQSEANLAESEEKMPTPPPAPAAPPQPVENAAPVNVNLLDGMSSAERYEVNIFLSNFSEVFYDPGSAFMGAVESKIDFAFRHASINSPNQTLYEDGYMGITAENVDMILTRFFGSSVPHSTPEDSSYWFYRDGKFLAPAASGESYGFFSVATNVMSRGDGTYNVSFNVYMDTSVVGGDVITNKNVYYLSDSEAAASYVLSESGTAVLREKTYNGKATYEVVSYNIA